MFPTILKHVFLKRLGRVTKLRTLGQLRHRSVATTHLIFPLSADTVPQLGTVTPSGD